MLFDKDFNIKGDPRSHRSTRKGSDHTQLHNPKNPSAYDENHNQSNKAHYRESTAKKKNKQETLYQ